MSKRSERWGQDVTARRQPSGAGTELAREWGACGVRIIEGAHSALRVLGEELWLGLLLMLVQRLSEHGGPAWDTVVQVVPAGARPPTPAPSPPPAASSAARSRMRRKVFRRSRPPRALVNTRPVRLDSACLSKCAAARPSVTPGTRPYGRHQRSWGLWISSPSARVSASARRSPSTRHRCGRAGLFAHRP